MTAVWRRMSVRISEGIVEMGHNGAGERSVGGSSAEIERAEKEAMSWDIFDEAGGPSREW